MSKKIISVDTTTIQLSVIDGMYYLSLYDLAKQNNPTNPEIAVASWIESKSTLAFLKAWEEINNADFKNHEVLEFKGLEQLIKDIFTPQHSMSPQKWVTYTNGIGFEIEQGKTWVAESIAFNFAVWLNPSYKMALEIALQQYKERIDTILDKPLNYN